MSWLRKVLHLEQRYNQLQYQEDIDKKLDQLPCDSIVRSYYRLCRETNRQQYFTAYNDLWNYTDHIETNEHVVDRDLANVNAILNREGCDKCLELQKYVSSRLKAVNPIE